MLLIAVALLISAQDLLWLMIVARNPASYTMTVALVALRSRYGANIPVLAAGLTLFGLVAFAFFFVVFGLLQALYLDRLALGTHRADKT